jgi:acyl-CoA synthetase (NDP forming)
MVASAGGASYRKTIEAVLSSQDVDALIVIYTLIDRNESESIAEAIQNGILSARSNGCVQPVVTCMMVPTGTQVMSAGSETIPAYRFPETAAKVLSKTAAYAEWLSKPIAMVPGYEDIDLAKARRVISGSVSRDESWLSSAEVRDFLTAFGIPQVPGALAFNRDEAASIAASLGFPVVMKLASQRVIHKSDIGAVRLNVRNEDEVRQIFDGIRQEDMEGILIQKMVPAGVELMIGVVQDPLFGPLVAFGLGGIHVEILADVQFRVTPLTDQDAREMVREIRGFRLLQGYRGHAAADIDAIEQILLRVSNMVEEIREIMELDLNPLFGLPPGEGCLVADARIRVAPAKRGQR